jgi:hypothetical protein
VKTQEEERLPILSVRSQRAIWWLLHVGRKDVGERVRRGVEEVFYGYVVIVFFSTVYLLISIFLPAFL